MDAPLASLRRAVFRLAEQGAGLSALYHRVRLLGCEHLPLKGPVLLVGNHGVWGYETPAFFHLIHQGTGRYPLGLTERGFFRIPLIRTVLPWLGGVAGTRENAMTALRADSRVGRGIPMLETLSSRPGGHPHGPPLVPMRTTSSRAMPTCLVNDVPCEAHRYACSPFQRATRTNHAPWCVFRGWGPVAVPSRPWSH